MGDCNFYSAFCSWKVVTYNKLVFQQVMRWSHKAGTTVLLHSISCRLEIVLLNFFLHLNFFSFSGSWHCTGPFCRCCPLTLLHFIHDTKTHLAPQWFAKNTAHNAHIEGLYYLIYASTKRKSLVQRLLLDPNDSFVFKKTYEQACIILMSLDQSHFCWLHWIC